MKKPTTWAIIILSILVVILGYIAFQPNPNPYNEELAKHELERLKQENSTLVKTIAGRDVKIIGFNTKIDSLESLKPIIKTIYVTKYKEIDNASATAISNEFNNIFTNAGIE